MIGTSTSNYGLYVRPEDVEPPVCMLAYAILRSHLLVTYHIQAVITEGFHRIQDIHNPIPACKDTCYNRLSNLEVRGASLSDLIQFQFVSLRCPG